MISLKFSKRKVIFYRGNKVVIGGLTSQNKIDILLYVSQNLIHISDQNELWNQILNLLIEIFEPDRISIYLAIKKNNINGKKSSDSFSLNLLIQYESDISKSKGKNLDNDYDKEILETVVQLGNSQLILDLKSFYGKNYEGSLVVVPVKYEKEILGIIVIQKEIPYFYKKDDKEILGTIASLTSISLTKVNLLKNLYESNKRIQYDLNIGKKIQRLILQSHHLPWNGIYFFHYYEPMSEISGDYYRIFRNENFILIFLCDVSGHGIAAAMITLVIHQILESILSKTSQLQEIVKSLSDLIKPYLPDGVYFTAQLLKVYHDYHFEFVNCGQTPLLCFKYKDKTFSEMDAYGLPLGIGDIERDNVEIKNGTLNGGDVLIFYTDGFIEQTNSSGEQFGFSRLKEIFLEEILFYTNKNVNIEPESLAISFFTHFENFVCGSPIKDDLSLIVVSLTNLIEEVNKELYDSFNKIKDYKTIYLKEKSMIKNLYLAGIYYLQKKAFQEAEFYIREYIKYAEPDSYLFYLYLGYCLYQQKKYKESRQYFRIVISKQPENKKAIILLIKSYILDHQMEKAKYYYEQFSKIGVHLESLDFLEKIKI